MAHALSFFFFFFFTLVLSYHPRRVISSLAMQTAEISALFEVMSSLIEDPTWVQTHPHPCTDTPWPGIQCEMVQNADNSQDPFLHVTKIHVGPDLLNPPCKPDAELSPSIRGLPHLRTLSLLNCFVAPYSRFNLSAASFAYVAAMEQLVLKSNSGLFGEIPPGLATVKSLRVLSLSQNDLRGEIPGEIGTGLPRLKQLDLSCNHLVGQVPEEIGGLTSLAILDLSWNNLRGKIPPSIGQMTSLQKIDLSFNSLSETIPSELGDLEELVLLDLSHNSIAGPMPNTLSNLKALEYLLLEHNPIRTRVPSFVGELKRLTVVGLSSCGLRGPIPDSLGSLRNLTALALDKNELNGSVPPSLGALPRLGQLNLSQNQLSGEIGFAQDFVARLGNRLDVRDNKGLCRNRGLSSAFSLQAPACSNSSSDSRNGDGWGGPDRNAEGKPSSTNDEQIGSTSPPPLSCCIFSLSAGFFAVISILYA